MDNFFYEFHSLSSENLQVKAVIRENRFKDYLFWIFFYLKDLNSVTSQWMSITWGGGWQSKNTDYATHYRKEYKVTVQLSIVLLG